MGHLAQVGAEVERRPDEQAAGAAALDRQPVAGPVLFLHQVVRAHAKDLAANCLGSLGRVPQHAALGYELLRRRHHIPCGMPLGLVVGDLVPPHEVGPDHVHQRRFDDRRMFDVPAWEALGKDRGEVGVGELRERVLEDEHSDVGMASRRQVASLPDVRSVLVVPVLQANTAKAGTGKASQDLVQGGDQRLRAK